MAKPNDVIAVILVILVVATLVAFFFAAYYCRATGEDSSYISTPSRPGGGSRSDMNGGGGDGEVVSSPAEPPPGGHTVYDNGEFPSEGTSMQVYVDSSVPDVSSGTTGEEDVQFGPVPRPVDLVDVEHHDDNGYPAQI
ncbi:hypothetical protein F4861DRAFT_541902 [Xylaria intraflava]|nr:hypothetical protein F4861DRAFT_541902 [Xylaria intraflava]